MHECLATLCRRAASKMDLVRDTWNALNPSPQIDSRDGHLARIWDIIESLDWEWTTVETFLDANGVVFDIRDPNLHNLREAQRCREWLLISLQKKASSKI